MNEIDKRNNTEWAIIPSELAVLAMQDSGYQSTDYALAELIDNSVQAGASGIEVIAVDKYQLVNDRRYRRLSKIAVLDNGSGMDAKTIRMALQFGNGTHRNDRKGMGRFGMGLPNSSISQCRLVNVWSWKNGPDNAIHTYLDLDKIERGELSFVPSPERSPLPEEWRQHSKIIDTTGTLVVWDNLELPRLTWSTAETTFRHAGLLVGRIYRKFIDSSRLSIHLVSISEGGKPNRQLVRVNDPPLSHEKFLHSGSLRQGANVSKVFRK